jgi:hypothetical protein
MGLEVHGCANLGEARIGCPESRNLIIAVIGGGRDDIARF